MPGVPMIDDVELQATQWVRQEVDQGFARHRIAGLEGVVHQKLGRRSHRVVLSGVLLPETATEDLAALQEKASAGEQVTFTADITTALEVEHMVIASLAAEQEVGRSGQFAYTIVLEESPPLPPPAELSPFGGLGEFGVGDLGFDPGALDDALGDIADQAGVLGDALDSAMGAVEGLGALASLAELGSLSNPLTPLTDAVDELAGIGASVGAAVEGLGELLP
jgi:phage protein U